MSSLGAEQPLSSGFPTSKSPEQAPRPPQVPGSDHVNSTTATSLLIGH